MSEEMLVRKTAEPVAATGGRRENSTHAQTGHSLNIVPPDQADLTERVRVSHDRGALQPRYASQHPEGPPQS